MSTPDSGRYFPLEDVHSERHQEGAYNGEVFAEGVSVDTQGSYEVYSLQQDYLPTFNSPREAFARFPRREQGRDYYLEVASDFRIGIFSDTHFHRFNFSASNSEELNALFNDLDVIIFNGDMFDLWVSDHFETAWFWEMSRILDEQIAAGKQVVFIPGNHDENVDPVKTNRADWQSQVEYSKDHRTHEAIKAMVQRNQGRFAQAGIEGASELNISLPCTIYTDRLQLRHGDNYYIVEHGHDESLSGEFLSKKYQNNPFIKFIATERRVLARASVILSEAFKQNPDYHQILGHHLVDLYQHIDHVLNYYGPYLDEDQSILRPMVITGHVHQESVLAGVGLANVGSFLSPDDHMGYILRITERLPLTQWNSFLRIDKNGLSMQRRESDMNRQGKLLKPIRSRLLRLLGDIIVRGIT